MELHQWAKWWTDSYNTISFRRAILFKTKSVRIMISFSRERFLVCHFGIYSSVDTELRNDRQNRFCTFVNTYKLVVNRNGRKYRV